MTFEDFRSFLVNRRIVKWNGVDEITLDNGVVVSIEETAQDCCAHAYGCFENVKIDAAIIGVTEPKYTAWEDGDTYGCGAEVKILYNDLDFCRATADADAGNGGYYFSVASFVVKNIQKNGYRKDQFVHFVESSDS